MTTKPVADAEFLQFKAVWSNYQGGDDAAIRHALNMLFEGRVPVEAVGAVPVVQGEAVKITDVPGLQDAVRNGLADGSLQISGGAGGDVGANYPLLMTPPSGSMFATSTPEQAKDSSGSGGGVPTDAERDSFHSGSGECGSVQALTPDEIEACMRALAPDHEVGDFEPECPGCTAYKKLAAILSSTVGRVE